MGACDWGDKADVSQPMVQPVLLPPAGLPHSWGPLSQVLAVVYITSTSVCVCVCACVRVCDTQVRIQDVHTVNAYIHSI